ncbi:hypothetical protein [Nocardioides convexus]|uniref:hypothetical protein n=1 Tax=Nocardioides convexus TaxID=2712224 RepID=UPI00241856C3|nr:hypothetical protein [Nocardioides convexus]
MLHRRPEGSALATALGLPLTHPTRATSRIWTHGALRPLPRSVMGAPLDLDQARVQRHPHRRRTGPGPCGAAGGRRRGRLGG